MLSSKKNIIKNYEVEYKGKEIKISTEIYNFLNIFSTVKMVIDNYSMFGIIYSISMNYIRIILKEKNETLLILAKNKNLCSIQLAENSYPKNNKTYFHFLPVELLDIYAYSYQDKKYNLLTLKFLSSLPEEIAIKVGKLFELKFGQNHRIHERIIVDNESIKQLKIDFDKSFIKFNGSKHKCLIKDLSYGGALVISFFNYEDAKNDEIDLIFSFEFMNKEILIEGKSRSLNLIQTVNGKAFAIGIAFNENKIPFEYTLLIHDYFTQKQYI